MDAFTDRTFYQTPTNLPSKFLKEIIKEIETTTHNNYVISLDDVLDTQVRSSKQAWLHWDNWIAGICFNIMMAANKQYFHYDLDHFDSGLQSTIYTEGDHYDWHTDPLASNTGKERKLSMSLLLNEEYEGGELEFDYKPWYKKIKPKAGQAIIFPAWIPHRVLPVTKGKRISLVAWINGPHWK